jgi:hypothetical protein
MGLEERGEGVGVLRQQIRNTQLPGDPAAGHSRRASHVAVYDLGFECTRDAGDRPDVRDQPGASVVSQAWMNEAEAVIAADLSVPLWRWYHHLLLDVRTEASNVVPDEHAREVAVVRGVPTHDVQNLHLRTRR